MDTNKMPIGGTGPTLRKRKSPTSNRWRYYAKFCGKTFSFGIDYRIAKIRFDQLKGEWLANGRRLPGESDLPAAPELAIQELYDRYTDYRRARDGASWQRTGRYRVRYSFEMALELYGALMAKDFSPRKLEEVRTRIIEDDKVCRAVINMRIREIKRAFRWAAANELVPGDVWKALDAVEGLRRGEFGVRDNPPREAVSEADVMATVPYLSRQVRSLVLLIWHTGARPSEIFGMSPACIDRNDKTWVMPLEEHKTAKKGKRREIVFGPKARDVLRPWLDRCPPPDPNKPLFSPADALAEYHEQVREQGRCDPRRLTQVELAFRVGVVPVTIQQWEKSKGMPRNEDGTYDFEAVTDWMAENKAPRDPMKPKARRWSKKQKGRTLGDTYTSQSLHAAIKRAIAAANRDRALEGLPEIEAWSPYRLRHAAAERIRREFGLEAVRSVLGHASAEMSEVYAAVDVEQSKRVMESCG